MSKRTSDRDVVHAAVRGDKRKRGPRAAPKTKFRERIREIVRGANAGWTPVYDPGAHTFCSPLCGYGCTIEEYHHAVEAGRGLAACLDAAALRAPKPALTGRWKPHIWENIGWHYRAELGCYKVWPVHDNTSSETRGWIATFAGTYSYISRRAHGKTPEEALLNVRAAVQEVLSDLAKEIKS
jgi:hypothetical protein